MGLDSGGLGPSLPYLGAAELEVSSSKAKDQLWGTLLLLLSRFSHVQLCATP